LKGIDRRCVVDAVADGGEQAVLATHNVRTGIEQQEIAGAVGVLDVAGRETHLPEHRSEGAPSTFVEALFAGLPIITPDVGGVRDLVQHGYTGLVTPAGDEGALADALGSVALAEGPRAQMATAARAAAAP